MILLIVAAARPGASPAAETYPSRYVGAWEVYGWGNDCWISRTFEDETKFTFSWNPTKKESYLHLANPNWTSIKDGKSYDLRIVLGAWEFDAASGGKHRQAETPAVSFFAEEPERFRRALASEPLIAISLDAKLLGDFDLEGSALALRELERCTALFAVRPPDPFAE